MAAALVVVATVALGGAAWTATHPPTTEVTDHTHRQTVESAVETSAVVTGDTTLYEAGRTLTDLPVYPTAAAPVLTLGQTTTVPAGGPVEVTQRLTLVYRATHGKETFWQDERTLVENTTTTRSGAVTAQAQLDVPAVQRRITEIKDRIGGAGVVRTELHVTVSYETDRYAATLTDSAEIGFVDGWYHVDAVAVKKTHSTPKTRSVAVSKEGRTTPFALGIVGLISLAAATGIGASLRYGSPPRSPADIEHDVHRLRYAEWISEGSVPDDVGEDVVMVASLEGLVDVAIDTENRVIHDPDRQRYAVIDGPTVYYYDAFWDPLTLE